jgi:hypothetical protein
VRVSTYLDDPDENDRIVLTELRKLGVTDAFKESKTSADYGKATGTDQCIGCARWEMARTQDLSTCRKIEGLVRRDRWCRRFQEATNVETDSQATQRPARQQVRGAGPQLPGGHAGPGGGGQEPGDAGREGGTDESVDRSKDQGEGQSGIG